MFSNDEKMIEFGNSNSKSDSTTWYQFKNAHRIDGKSCWSSKPARGPVFLFQYSLKEKAYHF